MVATKDSKSEIHCQKRKGFHTKYLSICKAKNIQILPEVKMKQKNIHILDFHADRVKLNDWLAICNALESDRTLKFLAIRLRKNDLMVFEDIDTLKKARSVISNPIIYAKFIFMELLNALQGLLTHNTQLEVLILEGLPMYGRYMTRLASGLFSNRSIKILSFARSNIGDEACEILCSNIKHLPNIESVNFSQCILGVKGIISIRDFIRFQKINRFSEAWIRSLRYQNIENEKFDGIKKILMNNNPQIGDEGIEILTDELREDVWIKEIEMQNCGLTDVGANHVKNCLEINKTILSFNINNNHDISNHLLRNISMHFGSSTIDIDSSDSSDTKSIHQKISKTQLLDDVKFLQDQLKLEICKREELEKSNEELKKQFSQVLQQRNEISVKNESIHIPEGYTLLSNDELERIVAKKSPMFVHKSYSSAVIRLRRKRTTRLTVKKTRSFVGNGVENKNLTRSKSENIISTEDETKKIFIEKNIGDSIEIGSHAFGSTFLGSDLLRCFTKQKHHVNEMGDDIDPRAFFGKRSGIAVPLNSDNESDL